MEDPELLEIDPIGDLILDASSPTAKRLIRVSSKALCLASPVFRAMLGPSSQFLEAKALHSSTSEEPFEMLLEGDDYASLRMLMNAVHLRTRAIPWTITVDEFYHLAVVCDKYDVAEIFVPWVDIWTCDFTDFSGTPGYERWFAISWVFRLEAIFTEVTRQLIFDLKLDQDGCLMTSSAVEVEVIPDSVIESIRASRTTAIASLVSLADAEVGRYCLSKLKGCHACNLTVRRYSDEVCVNSRNECDSLALGALIRCLFTTGVWPVPEPPQWGPLTVGGIVQGFLTIESFGKILTEDGGSTTHSDCGSMACLHAKCKTVTDTLEGLKMTEFRGKETIFFPNCDQELLPPCIDVLLEPAACEMPRPPPPVTQFSYSSLRLAQSRRKGKYKAKRFQGRKD